jgi:hypothetical protein
MHGGVCEAGEEGGRGEEDGFGEHGLACGRAIDQNRRISKSKYFCCSGSQDRCY